MAAELVGEAFLSSTFQVIFQRMASQEFTDLFHGKKPIVELLDKFKIKLKSANALLSDVEQKLIRDRNVRDWLAELKDVIYEAYDLIDKIDSEALRSKMEQPDESECGKGMLVKFNIPTSFTEFDEAVKPEIEKTLEKLSFLVDQKYELGLVENATNRSLQRLPAPWREKVYGRDSEKEAILKSLLLDDVKGCVSVIPIAGMGGIGKTTLAQLIFNDQTVIESFELKVWVTVSEEFDVYKMMKMIFRKVTCEKCDIEDLSELQCELKKALRGKKFFLVLDDVWNENYNQWDFLKSTFESGARGSKIIVTTRNSAVARVMSTGQVHKLHEVADEDCWQLFVDHAFDEDSDHPHPALQAIGREIVKKCKGLPLAVKSLGGLLHFERDPKKWRNVLKSDVWELYETQNDEILPALWLSYYYLPSNVKQCFAYCSIFPKDYEFEKERLILLWMAEGLLQHKKGKSMEEVGDQYFEDLVSRSFFQQSSQHKSSKDKAPFVMHDLIHDLATFVAGEFCFRLDEDNALDNLATKTRHLSCMTYIEKVAGLFKAESLHTLLAIRGGVLLDLELHELLPTLGCLRVLSVLRSFNLPDSIGKLKHLRYLNLSSTKVERIPDSVCTLYNLQTMLLSNCEKLTQLPKNMKRLINLRHLDTSYSPLEEMPPEMSRLKNLQTLTDFVLGKPSDNERRRGFSNIKELGDLHHLQGKLRISRLQNTNNAEDVMNANLKDKENLSELALEWEGQSTDTRMEEQVLEALQPHINLKKLTIRTFSGSSFPNWVGDSLFSSIVFMHLSNNEHCSSLPSLAQLPSLRELEIISFHGVETIGAEFYGKDSLNSTTPFPSLEVLRFDEMPKWKEWLCIGDDRECIQGVFPRLKELHLSGCPNLTASLPESSTIETLTFSGCGNLSFPRNQFYTSLKNLDIYGAVCDSMESLPLENFPNLTKLRLRGCGNLKQLTRDSSEDMIIETLEIKGCKRLEFIGNFHYSSVRKLTIVKSCDSLNSFPLNYFPKLNSLDLRHCQNLESFTYVVDDQAQYCSTALELLNSFKLIQCKKLRSLPEQMGTLLPSLGLLLIEDCPEVEIFPQGGLPSSLIHLVISNCSKLVSQHTSWDLQRLTSLASLTIEDCDDVELELFPGGLLPTSLTSLSLQNLPHLKSLNGNAFRCVASLEELWIADCYEIQCLPEEVLRFASLVELSIYYCPFLERRYQREEGEDWLKVSRIPRLKIQGDTTW